MLRVISLIQVPSKGHVAQYRFQTSIKDMNIDRFIFSFMKYLNESKMIFLWFV